MKKRARCICFEGQNDHTSFISDSTLTQKVHLQCSSSQRAGGIDLLLMTVYILVHITAWCILLNVWTTYPVHIIFCIVHISPQHLYIPHVNAIWYVSTVAIRSANNTKHSSLKYSGDTILKNHSRFSSFQCPNNPNNCRRETKSRQITSDWLLQVLVTFLKSKLKLPAVHAPASSTLLV